METRSYPDNPLANLSPSAPFPFSIKREEEDRLIFGDKNNFREIKPNFSDRKSGFRFEHMATEFENNMDENDSGIGKQKISVVISFDEKLLLTLFFVDNSLK